MLLYRTDALAIGYRASLEADDPYLSALSEKWSQSLNRAFRCVEEPDWPIQAGICPAQAARLFAMPETSRTLRGAPIHMPRMERPQAPSANHQAKS